MSRKSGLNRVDIAAVREFQSDVAEFREQPPPRSAMMTIHVLCLAVVATGVLMGVAQVDRVISSSKGTIITTEPPTVFQALDPSVIRSIDVKEGQRVEKGQLLATLDPTFAAATVNQLKAQIVGLRTQIARDEALIAHRPLIFNNGGDPDEQRYEKDNQAYYEQQMAQYTATMNSFDQKIATLETTIQKYKVDQSHYEDESEINKQIEEMRATLQQHGSGSLLNLLNATTAKLESLRSMEFDVNSRVEAEHQLASAQADQKAYVQQFNTAASQDLLTSRNSLDSATAQLQSALKHQDLVRIQAPEASLVLSIAKNVSVGSVLIQGANLMTLSPVRTPVEAQVQILARDIGFIRPGDSTTMKVDAYNFVEHGTVSGTVKWISDGAFTVDENNQPTPAAYYNVGVAIDKVDFFNVPPTTRLAPGMTLTADIKVGRRSIWDYVVGEIVHHAGDSMREP